MAASMLDEESQEFLGEGVMPLPATVADPDAADVRALQRAHREFCLSVTPAENAHALESDAIADPLLTIYGIRREGVLLAIGALRPIDDGHVEIKSMHTATAARGQGVGRLMLEHLLAAATERGYARVSLETGTADAFAAARAMYAAAGFTPCPPFGDYRETADNTYFTLDLGGPGDQRRPKPNQPMPN